MFTEPSKTVVKILPTSLGLIICCLLLFISCPMAPPEDPAKGLNPYLSPAAPQSLVATCNNLSQISVSWDEVPYATSYELWGIKSSEFGVATNTSLIRSSSDSVGFNPNIKGFQWIADITEAKYLMSNMQLGESYVFCVRAVRDLGDEVLSDQRLLKSVPSSYVEGCTIATPELYANATSTSVKLFWNVQNLYKVLGDTIDDPLYKFRFVLKYRKDGTLSWVEKDMGQSFACELSTSDAINEIEQGKSYEFVVEMIVLDTDGGDTNISVPSASRVVTTNKNNIPNSVSSVSVSKGLYKQKIEIGWKVPDMPPGLVANRVFKIERQKLNVDGSYGELVTVLDESKNNGTDGTLYMASHSPDDDTASAFSWTDESVAENAVYIYKVHNGYEIGRMTDSDGNVTERGVVYWSDESVVSDPCYGLWNATDLTVEISKEKVEGAGYDNKVTYTYSWTYDYPLDESYQWWVFYTVYENGKLQVLDSSTMPTIDGANKEIVFTSVNGSEGSLIGTVTDKTYKVTDSISQHDSTVREYTPYLAIVDPNDSSVQLKTFDFQNSVAMLGDVLANNEIVADSFVATTDRVNEIQVSWELNATISEDDVEKIKFTLVADTTSGEYEPLFIDVTIGDEGADLSYDQSTRKVQYLHSFVKDESSHYYRLTYTMPVSESETAVPIWYRSRATGNILPRPQNVEATDGTSSQAITISWAPPSSSDIMYHLYYRKNGSPDWIKITDEINSSSGQYLFTEDAGTTLAGTLYDFKMTASNDTFAPSKETADSVIDSGCLFGAAAMELTATQAEYGDKIILTWRDAVGADTYDIYRKVSGSADDTFGERIAVVNKNTGTYSDASWAAANTDIVSGSTPLSEKYTYAVCPVNAKETVPLVLSARAEGYLFAPPTGISATKGKFNNQIEVTWNRVEGATAYSIEPYTMANGVPNYSYGSVTYNVRSNEAANDTYTYKYPVDSTNRSLDWYFRIRASKAEVTSLPQNGFDTIMNEYQEVEPSNLGYTLLPSDEFKAHEVCDTNEVYRPYVQLEWTKVNGAEQYLLSALGVTTVVKVSDLNYFVDSIATNGKGATEVGYLAYDPVSKRYVYNDATGILTNSLVIPRYALRITSNDAYTDVNDEAANETYKEQYVDALSQIVGYRRALKPQEVVNLVNEPVQYVLKKANEAFDGDWWPYGSTMFSSHQDTYSSIPGVTIKTARGGGSYTNETNISSDSDKASLSMTNYARNGLILNTPELVLLRSNTPSNYLGDNSLAIIGREAKGWITMQVSEHGKGTYPEYSVKYNTINVKNISSDNTYTVRIDGTNHTVNDSNAIVRPF